MKLNLKEVPFSTSGSYMAVALQDDNFHNSGLEAGIYLRSVHGDSKIPYVAKIMPLMDGAYAEYHVDATPEKMEIHMDQADITIAFDDDETLILAGEGEKVGVEIDFMPSGKFDFIQPVLSGEATWYLINCYKSHTRYMCYNQSGDLQLIQQWNADSSEYSKIRLKNNHGSFLLVLQEVYGSWKDNGKVYEIEDVCRKTRQKFDAFYHSMPSVPAEYESARFRASYVNWSSIVKKHLFLTRDAMLMSKNWMCRLWSWDHCFNAMALAYGNPEEAWNQFMVPFDFQTETGRLLDSVSDSMTTDNYCKPPIHGWTLHKLKQIMDVDLEKQKEAYEKLVKWTEWWLNYRDQDQDGLCEYTHGNDSGWDNSTAFRMLPPVTAPDTAAFLVLQMEELSELAAALGRSEEANIWKSRSDEMLERMLQKLFFDGKPHAIQTVTGEVIETESLILYLPIILGEKLPEEIRTYMISQLKSDRFLTEHGLATESPASELYVPDGYWRGPIWAPSTMILLDGLWRCGEHEFVKDLTHRFCRMVQNSGCAENFDALTGEGLRDRAYTWTSSVMLVMAHEFLD